jgi:hypothetical protein
MAICTLVLAEMTRILRKMLENRCFLKISNVIIANVPFAAIDAG